MGSRDQREKRKASLGVLDAGPRGLVAPGQLRRAAARELLVPRPRPGLTEE